MTASPVVATEQGGGRRSTTARADRRALVVVLFVTYLVLLVWLVIWKLDVPHVGDAGARGIKLIPFVRTAEAGSNAPAEVVANVVIFVPFGVYLGLLARSWPWWTAVSVLVGASLALEVAQYALAVGKSDVTDIIVNTAGGVAGMVVAALVRRVLGPRTGVIMAPVLALGTVVAVLAAGLFVVAPLHHGPPRHPWSVSTDVVPGLGAPG